MKRMLAMMVAGCLGLGLTLAADQAGKSEVPAGAKGFAGMISGKVVASGENQVTVEVLKVEKAWKHSKAEKPEVLVGKQVVIKVIPTTYAKKEGYLAKVKKFLGSLKVGDTESFDVKHEEGDSLIFLELTESQLARGK